MNAWGIWIWGTTALIALFAGLTLVAVRAAQKNRHRGFGWIAGASAVCLILSIVANPMMNFLIFMPIYEPRVDAMWSNLKEDSFVGKSRAELIDRFGKPDKTKKTEEVEYLRYNCRPWFALSWSVVVVQIKDGVVAGFWIDD